MTRSETEEAIAWCKTFAAIDGCNPNHKIMKRCVEALEKQVPKKPNAKEMPYQTLSISYSCTCGAPVGCYDRFHGKYEIRRFCHGCGQAIDWGDFDE